jgi:hypothetical protein
LVAAEEDIMVVQEVPEDQEEEVLEPLGLVDLVLQDKVMLEELLTYQTILTILRVVAAVLEVLEVVRLLRPEEQAAQD